MNLTKKLTFLKYIILAVGIVVLILGLIEYKKIASLESEGETIQGKIHSRLMLNTGKGRSSYQLIVDYQPTKITIYRKEFTVTKDFYNSTKNTDEIEMKYLRDEPTVSGISGNITEQKNPLYVGLVAFILSMTIFLFLSFRITKMK